MGNDTHDAATAAPAPAGPMAGIKVVDMSVMIAGPLAAMMLADQGAAVIKVESPGMGDMMRHLGSSKNGMTGIYVNNNRGKRSLVIDVKQAAGVEAMRRLIADADVLIQNFRPGAMDRMGLGWDAMHELNPDLIYASISGYGPDGPNSGRRAYDNVIQAASGLASVQAHPATGEPELFRTLLCDKATAYTATQAITAALFARERGTARGQHIELAMIDTAVAFMWPDSAMAAVLLDDDAIHAPTIASMYGAVKLADGYAATSVVTESEFRAQCNTYGRPDLADDPRFADGRLRATNRSELNAELKESAALTTATEFAQRAAEFDLPAAVVQTLDELPHDPQIMNNEVFVERDHPVAGRVREPRPAARFGATPQRVSDHAPSFGQHSAEIVAELGLDPDELLAAGIIF